MKKLLTENKLVLLLLSALFIMFFLICYYSQATYDAGDGIRHYLVSRYSWQHHEQFLYSWGKPFFTLLSSPFSQFGLLGINVFNILCALSSAYICYKIAKQLGWKYPYLVIIFLCFTPCYFPTINSGLTEPLFGLVLIASIYLSLNQKYVWSALLVSFLPFVRSEGYFLLPLFFIVFVYHKKYITTLWLGFGTLVYSIIGYFYFKDFLWLIHQNPYDGKNKAFYGQGELLHFVKSYNFLWGSALTYLLYIGLISLCFIILSKKKEGGVEIPMKAKLYEFGLLVIGSFLIYFAAHSVMWWKGLANSLGLLRVMAGVAPCSALISIAGFSLVMGLVMVINKYLKYGILILVTFWIIRSPFKHEYFPFKLNQEETVIKQAGDWFQTSPYTKQKVYYLYPLLAHVLNVDSFDPAKVGELWGLYPTIKTWGISAVPDSTIVFWDAHFGPNECHIPLDTIMNDPNFQLIKTIKPEEPFKTLGDYNFEVNVFMKLSKPKQMDVLQKDSFDLETLAPALLNTTTLTEENHFSGTHSSKLSAKNEYSVTIKKLVSELPANTKAIDFYFKMNQKDGNAKEAVAVISVDDAKGKNLFWDGKAIVLSQLTDVANGGKSKSSFAVNANSFPKDATIKLYVWNKKLKEFYIDDLEVVYKGWK